jgi:putative glutamine amidotransferase
VNGAADRHAPLIGIASYAEEARWGPWTAPAALLPVSYPEQVTAAGGIPVLLPPLPGVARAAARLDAVVLSGGGDLDPAGYGADPHPLTTRVYPERDRAERALLAAALAEGVPILAICRGMQILNATRGGTLHQHLPDVVGHDGHGAAPGTFGQHEVRVNPASRLGAILGPPGPGGELRLTVPTQHHQAIGQLGSGLIATAWADDGTIEAVEPGPAQPGRDGGQFLIGVQWHPEAGPDSRLFQALIAAARSRAGRGGPASAAAHAEPLDSRA